MIHLRISRRAAVLTVIGLGASLWTGCSDRSPDTLTGPSAQLQISRDQWQQDIQSVIAVHQRRGEALLRIPGVVGTAVGLLPNGKVGLKILLARHGVVGLPTVLDGIPVTTQVTGMFVAFSDPTTRQRPAPMGFSVGHPAITAGSIGARVTDGVNVYILSNNHVLANSNDASIGDPELQPGAYDGGAAPADQIATLAAFKAIDFSGGGNPIDAAIARVTVPGDLANTTPTDDGYGVPNSAIFGDANGDGAFDNINSLLGLNVQKYGRTTKLTHGQITGINATVTVCYEVFFGFCLKAATFVDQLIIEPGTFSGGGDSGSLIVTDDASKSPVGLLFAGSSTQTIANRIDLVLSNFGVHVDGGNSPPPTPVTDVAITSVAGPASVTQGSTVNVAVTIRNVGNQSVGGFDVTLQDATDQVTIGTQSVAGLMASGGMTLSFSWNTTGRSLGSHTLTAMHTLKDDNNAANNQASTAVTVNDASNVIHIGNLDATTSSSGTRWSATVEITVHDANHNPLNGATVVGHWSQLGTNSNTCTTGDLGGNGTCIVLFPSLKRSVTSVNMTVVSVTLAGRTYDRTLNHDVDGSSNGTTIKVNRP